MQSYFDFTNFFFQYEGPVPVLETSLIESSESESTDDEDDVVVVKEEKVNVESSIKKICSKKNCNNFASIDVIGASNGDKVCVDCFVDAKSANVSSKGYIPNAADESEDNSMELRVSHTIQKRIKRNNMLSEQ